MYIHIYVYVYIYIHTCVFMYLHRGICIYVYMYRCTCGIYKILWNLIDFHGILRSFLLGCFAGIIIRTT